MEEKKGVLFVLSGPSGVGKGTVKAPFLEEYGEEISFSVSVTTRARRPGEVEGKDYFYVTQQEFDQLVENHMLLEHAEFAGNRYGTPRAYVEKLLSEGKNVLLEIEIDGSLQVMQNMPDCVSIFILPPSMEELEKRLRGRGTESEESVQRRLDRAKYEITFAPKYKYQIVNDVVEEATAKLRQIYLDNTRG